MDWQVLLLLIGWCLAFSLWAAVAMRRHRAAWQMAGWIALALVLFGWYASAQLTTSESLRKAMYYVGSALALLALLAWAHARKSHC